MGASNTMPLAPGSPGWRELLAGEPDYRGPLREKPVELLGAPDVFAPFAAGDRLDAQVFDECIFFWGMAVANLVSFFNPEMIVFGGGSVWPGGAILGPDR